MNKTYLFKKMQDKNDPPVPKRVERTIPRTKSYPRIMSVYHYLL